MFHRNKFTVILPQWSFCNQFKETATDDYFIIKSSQPTLVIRSVNLELLIKFDWIPGKVLFSQTMRTDLQIDLIFFPSIMTKLQWMFHEQGIAGKNRRKTEWRFK